MIQPFLRHKISAVVKKAVKQCQCRCISAASRTEEASHSTSIEPKKSFYRRPLPDTCVAFSSKQGRFLLAQALQENSLKSYFPLAVSASVSVSSPKKVIPFIPIHRILQENFITQSEPAFCGLGSLAMCFNALGMDPGRVRIMLVAIVLLSSTLGNLRLIYCCPSLDIHPCQMNERSQYVGGEWCINPIHNATHARVTAELEGCMEMVRRGNVGMLHVSQFLRRRDEFRRLRRSIQVLSS